MDVRIQQLYIWMLGISSYIYGCSQFVSLCFYVFLMGLLLFCLLYSVNIYIFTTQIQYTMSGNSFFFLAKK